MDSNNIFELAEQCLYQASIESTLLVTRRAKARMTENRLEFSSPTPVKPVQTVCFPGFLKKVEAKDLPRRQWTTVAGRVALLHAVAHIEYSAILLHWDGLYRFRGLPKEYYLDWLQVATEEMEHFRMLQKRLRDLGSDYGQLPVHGGLWQVAEDTAGDVLARIALVPRCMEARGLDVTPAMIEKFEQVGDLESASILSRILRDEVGHVRRGSHWFQYLCQERGLAVEETYFQLLSSGLQGTVRGPFNRQLRIQAGFSDAEIQRLEKLSPIL